MNKRGEALKKLYKELKREMEKKSISSIVKSEEMEKIINYSPNYQRNYVWNDYKAIKLIETIILNREVPPLTIIEDDDSIEIIDGRQRYETLLNFYNDKFSLKAFGLSILKPLDNLKYSELPSNVRTIFDEYKLKFITYKVDKGTKLTVEEVSKIKRDLFRRYNYGMTALNKSEVARAKYLYDELTISLREEFSKNINDFRAYCDLYLPLSKKDLSDRDKLNSLLITSRELVSMPYVPIIGVKNVKIGVSNIEKYYEFFVKKENINDKKNEFLKITQKLEDIKRKLEDRENNLSNNNLFFKSVYWMLAILYKKYSLEFYNFDMNRFIHYLEGENNAEQYFSVYKNLNSEHVIKRHTYLKGYMVNSLGLDLDGYFESIIDNRQKVVYKAPEKLRGTGDWQGIKKAEQITTISDYFSLRDIIKLQRSNRFIVRPIYQRNEVRSLEKASKIIESIILGIKLPPVYAIVSINDSGLKEYTIIDGQQRLISILTFLGEQVLDENYDFIKTFKRNYTLRGLKDLEYLNGRKYSGDNAISDADKQLILDYKMDFILIDEKNNNFDPVDMFLRLNENPCVIGKNSFEMWNSFDIVDILNKIKEISKYSLFEQKAGNAMKEEELVTVLAFMDKEKVNLDNFYNFFKVHLCMQNKNKVNERVEVKLSIRNKGGITHYLEYLDCKEDEEKKYIKSLDNVENFIKKLDILFKDDYDRIIKIFNPYIASPRKGSMKDFYLLWMILDKFDSHLLNTYKESIIEDLTEMYKLMKNMPLNRDLEYFFDYVNGVIDKYRGKFVN